MKYKHIPLINQGCPIKSSKKPCFQFFLVPLSYFFHTFHICFFRAFCPSFFLSFFLYVFLSFFLSFGLSLFFRPISWYFPLRLRLFRSNIVLLLRMFCSSSLFPFNHSRRLFSSPQGKVVFLVSICWS
jgi:hypothetical protein